MEIGAEGAAGKRRHKEEGVKRRPTACPVTGGLCPAEHRSAQNKNITLCSCWTATVSPVLLALFQTFQGTGSERLFFFSPSITGALQIKKGREVVHHRPPACAEIQKRPCMSNSSSSRCVGSRRVLLYNYSSFIPPSLTVKVDFSWRSDNAALLHRIHPKPMTQAASEGCFPARSLTLLQSRFGHF